MAPAGVTQLLLSERLPRIHELTQSITKRQREIISFEKSAVCLAIKQCSHGTGAISEQVSKVTTLYNTALFCAKNPHFVGAMQAFCKFDMCVWLCCAPYFISSFVSFKHQTDITDRVTVMKCWYHGVTGVTWGHQIQMPSDAVSHLFGAGSWNILKHQVHVTEHIFRYHMIII
jgi:hypothetical protein